jgi:hypothetical protein
VPQCFDQEILIAVSSHFFEFVKALSPLRTEDSNVGYWFVGVSSS